MSAIAAAVDTLYRDPNLGTVGVYTAAGGGGGVTVHAIVTTYDQPVELAGIETRARNKGTRIDLLRSEVPIRPTEGATLVLAGVTYGVRDVEEDEEGVAWRADIYPA